MPRHVESVSSPPAVWWGFCGEERHPSQLVIASQHHSIMTFLPNADRRRSSRRHEPPNQTCLETAPPEEEEQNVVVVAGLRFRTSETRPTRNSCHPRRIAGLAWQRLRAVTTLSYRLLGAVLALAKPNREGICSHFGSQTLQRQASEG